MFLHNFFQLIEEIFWHVSTKFYCKILKTSKVMKFLRNISKFQIKQAYKMKKKFFQNFYFLFKLTKLTKREYAWEISSLHTEADKEDRAENRARKAIWNDFPQESIKKAVLAFRKRLQACIRAEVNALSTYFHSNQHSLEVDFCLLKLG